ncbi:MAG: hypothetical protein WCT47_01755 [Betaproteobacteria bacterium]|jgi:hypothetical protein
MLPIKLASLVLVIALIFGVVQVEHGYDHLGGQRWVKFSVKERTVIAVRELLAQAVEASSDRLAADRQSSGPQPRAGPLPARPQGEAILR